jgi:hypothetical protein
MRMTSRRGLAVLAAVAALVLVPTAAQADTQFYAGPIFGIANGPGGSLFVADAGKGIVDADTGTTSAFFTGMSDVAPIGKGEALAVGFHETAGGPQIGVFRISKGRGAFVADTQAFEEANDPAGDGTDEGSNPFDLARMNGGKALVADAAGNSLLVVDEKGRIDWVASFPVELVSTQHLKDLFGCPAGPPDFCNLPAMIPAQPVPTSVAIGPDGAYYVGELKGFPSPTGESRVWRIEPGARHAQCGSSPQCTVVLDGFTSIIDLAFGPDGRLNVAQLDDAGWFAAEVDEGIGGSVHACSLATKACQTLVDGVPLLTSIAYRGNALWGASWALVPGLADVTQLAP